MFRSEDLSARGGPKVFLLNATPDPLGAVAATCKMYKGEVVRSLNQVTDDERRYYLGEMLKTKLKAPLEFVKVHFMLEGVTRSFTHQMVRQRTAVYAQESLRFAVVEDGLPERTKLPPSLQGTRAVWRKHFEDIDRMGLNAEDAEDRLRTLMELESEAEQQRWAWDAALESVQGAYTQLVETGVPAEDARGLLPHNVTTRLHYATDFRALWDHAGNRLCTQAQFEWRHVFTKISMTMRNYSSCPGHDTAEQSVRCRLCDNWQWRALADVFRPVCYATGKCEFTADFDRACSIRDRVQAFHANGIPSSEWDQPQVDQRAHVPGFPDDYIQPISPVDWVLDPEAAR